MAFCEQCGKELDAGLRFCTECGAPVEDLKSYESTVEASVVDVSGAGADAIQAVESAVETMKTITDTFGQTIDAPAAAGETVLSTWQGTGAGIPTSAASVATQAIGTVIGQAQKVAQDTQTKSDNQAEQVKSHEPTIHYSSSGGEAKPAPAAKKSKLPLIAVGVGAVLVIVVLMLYVVPLFQFQPHDPNEDKALTYDSAASASASASSVSASSGSAASSSASSASASASAASTSASSAASSTSASVSSASAGSASGGSATSGSSGAATSSSQAASSAAASSSYSTSERPVINEFKWTTGETDKGNAPSGVKRITDFGTVMGSWKGYMHGGNLERLFNVTIDAAQSGATATFNWYYIRDNKAGKVYEDSAANSTFTGKFDGGMLDATGSGRLTLTAFWEQDGHQYATGSFMWPSGETEVISLVRP